MRGSHSNQDAGFANGQPPQAMDNAHIADLETFKSHLSKFPHSFRAMDS